MVPSMRLNLRFSLLTKAIEDEYKVFCTQNLHQFFLNVITTTIITITTTTIARYILQSLNLWPLANSFWCSNCIYFQINKKQKKRNYTNSWC